MITQSKNRLNEEGIVSIVVTLIIMIVLTLIVTGFAQLARREQREALDRQLSAQASYAAESGINALKAALPYISANVTSRKDCNENTLVEAGKPNPFTSTSATLSDNSSYTCLLFNRQPKELIFQSIGADDAVIAPISLKDSSGNSIPLSNLNISWKAKTGSTTVNNKGLGKFPKAQEWGDSIGILRLDLIPIPDSTGISSAGLDAATKSFLLQPQASGEVERIIGSINNGDIIGVTCSSGNCSFNIKGLDQKKYYLRMRSIYNPSNVTLNNQVPGGVAKTDVFSGAQIEIDSTGRAADVLKRIKVRIVDPNSSVSTTSGPNFPEYVFSSKDNLCKRLSLTNTTSVNGCTY